MKKNIYINKSGTLSRKDNTLYFTNEYIKKCIPVEGLEVIYCLGQMNINTETFNLLNMHGIICHFFGYYGNYIGSFCPKEKYISGKLFIKQVESYSNIEKRLCIAKQIVTAIGLNMITTLEHYYKHSKIKHEVLTSLSTEIKKVAYAKNINHLLSIEGSLWSIYYSTIPIILNNDFGFFKRVKRPPDNPVNAVISFLNSLIYSKVTSKIYYTQLHHSVSYLHEPFDRRFSLSLDIAEAFKPLLTFQTMFKLFNKNMLSEKDFENGLEMCILNENGRSKVLTEFDNKLSETVLHPRLKRKYSYDGLIKLDLYKLIKTLFENKPFEPFLISDFK